VGRGACHAARTAISAFTTKGVALCPGTTGPQAITGLGFPPKFLICFGTGQTDDGFVPNASLTYGFATASNQCAAGFAVASRTTTQAARHWSTARAINLPDSSGALLMGAAANSFGADGFVLDWTAVVSGAQVHYLAVGGTDYEQVTSGVDTMRTTAGTKVTSVGYSPTAMCLLSATAAVGGGLEHAKYSLGAVSQLQQWALAVGARSGQTMTTLVDAVRTQRADSLLLGLTDTGALEYRAAFNTIQPTGFELNYVTAPATGYQFGYLAWKHVDAVNQNAALHRDMVRTSEKPTNPAPQVYTESAPTSPLAMLWCSWGLASATTIQGDCEFSLGAADLMGNQGAVWVEARDAVLGMAASSVTQSQAMRMATAPNSVTAAATSSLTAAVATWELTWSPNPAVASQICTVDILPISPDQQSWKVWYVVDAAIDNSQVNNFRPWAAVTGTHVVMVTAYEPSSYSIDRGSAFVENYARQFHLLDPQACTYIWFDPRSDAWAAGFASDVPAMLPAGYAKATAVVIDDGSFYAIYNGAKEDRTWTNIL